MRLVLTAQVKNGLLYKAVQKCGNQSRLAEYLGVAPVTVGAWLNFKAVPNFTNPSRNNVARYERWDERLIALIGYGLDEIFPEEVRTNRAALQKISNMEAFIDAPIENLIAAGAVPHQLAGPDANVFRQEFNNVLAKMLDDDFTAQERSVIAMRFGLFGNTGECTLEEVGQEFNVTRERIRQIENKALRKLRHPAHSRHLKVFYERGMQ